MREESDISSLHFIHKSMEKSNIIEHIDILISPIDTISPLMYVRTIRAVVKIVSATHTIILHMTN